MSVTEFRLGIASGDAALVLDPYEELARMLDSVSAKLRDGFEAGTIRDSNGNRVGDWSLEIATDGEEGAS